MMVIVALASPASAAHGQTTGPVPARDGWWDLEHPWQAVIRHLVAAGSDPAYDFSPYTQAMVRRGWAAMFPVVVAIADDPSLGADPDRLQAATRQQVVGDRTFYTATAARDGWQRVAAALNRAAATYDAGQPVEPGLLHLAVLLSDPVLVSRYGQVAAYPAPEPECGPSR
jgi:hypothetical protein